MSVELVQTNSGFHVRKKADNGEIIWSTEVYESEGHARGVAVKEAGSTEIEVVDERSTPQ